MEPLSSEALMPNSFARAWTRNSLPPMTTSFNSTNTSCPFMVYIIFAIRELCNLFFLLKNTNKFFSKIAFIFDIREQQMPKVSSKPIVAGSGRIHEKKGIAEIP
jgi:hypothetical protein